MTPKSLASQLVPICACNSCPSQGSVSFADNISSYYHKFLNKNISTCALPVVGSEGNGLDFSDNQAVQNKKHEVLKAKLELALQRVEEISRQFDKGEMLN